MYNFLHITLIFFGAGIGGVFRYIISNKVTGFISKSLIVSNTYITFPFPTLFVNFVGSFVIGILYNIIIIKTPHLDVELKLLFITGFLGGFTTFSSFSLESVNLINQGHYIQCITYILLSITLCISGCMFGVLISKLF